VVFDEDRSLIEEVLSGRLEAFEGLIRKYQKPIFYFVQRMLRRQEDSDDVTQKTFVQAYRNLAKFRFESSFKTWLTKIAINLARNQLRILSRSFFELDDQVADEKTQNEMERREGEEEKIWLKQALDGLPPTQKEVVVLRIYDELSFKKIAQVVGSNEGTAKVNFHHGMRRLKEMYEKRRKSEE